MRQPNFYFHCIAYREKDNTFTGVCLDLDIVEEGHASLEIATESIKDAVASHLQAAKELGFPNELVNRPAPKKYWGKFGDRGFAFVNQKPIAYNAVNHARQEKTQPPIFTAGDLSTRR